MEAATNYYALTKGQSIGYGYLFEKELDIKELSNEPYCSHRRLKVFAAKGCTCVSCGRTGTRLLAALDRQGGVHIDVYTDDLVMLTVDHIQPKSLGGTEDLGNKQPMCCHCNRDKAATPPPEGEGIKSDVLPVKSNWKGFGKETATLLDQCKELPRDETLVLRAELYERMLKTFRLGGRVKFLDLSANSNQGMEAKFTGLTPAEWTEKNPWGFKLLLTVGKGKKQRLFVVDMRSKPRMFTPPKVKSK